MSMELRRARDKDFFTNLQKRYRPDVYRSDMYRPDLYRPDLYSRRPVCVRAGLSFRAWVVVITCGVRDNVRVLAGVSRSGKFRRKSSTRYNAPRCTTCTLSCQSS
eukprot:2135838-Rhodomonas_salina.1